MTIRHQKQTLAIVIAVLFASMGKSAFAHVKWFTDFDFLEKPLSLQEILTPTFLGFVVLSVVVIGGMVLIDRQLNGMAWYTKINSWLSKQQIHSLTVMRVAMAGVLLVTWASDAVLTPELTTRFAWLGWMQFVVAILLLFPRTTPLAGAGLLFIYGMGLYEFGLFHMLDYLHYAGISLYLLVSQTKNQRLHELGLPALYVTIGFSLIWLAFEKLYYPSWGLYLLEQNPQLALGLPTDFFLQGAAFVEISLGFLLLIGLLERPLAAIITLVFFTTTLIFGKLEVIGHTPLHAALIVFLFNGAGTFYKAPINIHEKMNWRVAFATVNFLIVVGIFAGIYGWSANRQYTNAIANLGNGDEHGSAVIDLTDAENAPEFTTIEVIEENSTSYNLHVEIDNWVFTPELAGTETVVNEGHAHVYVNGEKVGRMYSDWFHLGALNAGTNQIVVTLNGNEHSSFVVDGKIIGAEMTVQSE